MEKLGLYNIDLKNMRDSYAEYNYEIGDAFFADIEMSEIQKGDLDVSLSVRKSVGAFVLDFSIQGEVVVTCDRCLDDMSISVDTDDSIKVKLGAEFSDDDEIIIIPENDGIINVAWYIYEFIMLSLPIKHVHEDGECNEEMLGKLGTILRTEQQDDEDLYDEEGDEAELENSDSEKEIDPRWNALKKILNNN